MPRHTLELLAHDRTGFGFNLFLGDLWHGARIPGGLQLRQTDHRSRAAYQYGHQHTLLVRRGMAVRIPQSPTQKPSIRVDSDQRTELQADDILTSR